ncbi:E-selectin [Oryzias melastigma]|nr:E-selectin [Oryzias melastigma]
MKLSGFNSVQLQDSSSSWIRFFLLCSVLSLWGNVAGWSYHWSDHNMEWEEARKWCQQRYTDMVAIQNQEEILHLSRSLPKSDSYYWIGIRKINDVWTWVGTNKPLTPEATNWAAGEPNNGNDGSKEGQPEDCVEIYIKRTEQAGKWNDERCSKKKAALCYTASCTDDSCYNGECIETINNHTCKCLPGFYGSRCEHVVQCRKEDVIPPEHGHVDCSHKNGDFSYDSLCRHSCEDGYRLTSAGIQRCTDMGLWSEESPQCQLVKCKDLSPPPAGLMECSHPLGNHSYQSECVFSCAEGHKLDPPSSSALLCESSGLWSASTPSCVAVQCPALQDPENGMVRCGEETELKFSFKADCSFSCEAGFTLTGPGEVTCTSAGVWSGKIPECVEIKCPVPKKDAQLIPECSKPPNNLGVNSTCSFRCEPGFELQGAAHRKCSENGQWSGVAPTCKAVRCPPPEAPENGHINCSDGPPVFTSQCSITCDEGFTLDGHELLTCGRHGNWTGKPPTCQAPSYQMSAITSGVAVGGAAAVSGLSLAVWILKRMKSKASKFELNSNSDIDEPPQVYKNSIDSLI